MERLVPPGDGPQSSEHGGTPLHRAALVGDHAAIRALVTAGADVNSVCEVAEDADVWWFPATPLMVAAGSDAGASRETVALLLELGADPKVVLKGRSAVVVSLEGLRGLPWLGGDAQRAKMLLDAGSPLPSDPAEANWLLCQVAAAGDPARLRLLVEAGANAGGYWDPAKADEIDRALMHAGTKGDEQASSAPSGTDIPLFRAAESGSAECVRLLLEAGADATARDHRGRTAMFRAGSVEVVCTLQAAGLGLEDRDRDGATPLDLAVTVILGKQDLLRIKALVDAGADVNARRDHGYTVFMSALGPNRSMEVLRLLLAAGADPHAVSEYGWNAFHAAIGDECDWMTQEVARETLGFLKHLGVNIEQRTTDGRTPLTKAVQEGLIEEVLALCELGADVNATYPLPVWDGQAWQTVDAPMLFHALEEHFRPNQVVSAMHTAGADPTAKVPPGVTPLMRAMSMLCQGALDYAAAYTELRQALRQIKLDERAWAVSREAFVTEAAAMARPVVERFAASLPSEGQTDYAAELRADRIGCVATLWAYWVWAAGQRGDRPI